MTSFCLPANRKAASRRCAPLFQSAFETRSVSKRQKENAGLGYRSDAHRSFPGCPQAGRVTSFCLSANRKAVSRRCAPLFQSAFETRSVSKRQKENAGLKQGSRRNPASAVSVGNGGARKRMSTSLQAECEWGGLCDDVQMPTEAFLAVLKLDE